MTTSIIRGIHFLEIEGEKCYHPEGTGVQVYSTSEVFVLHSNQLALQSFIV